MKLTRGDFEVLPTILFSALPSAVAGRHASRLHYIVLRPTALSLKFSCAVLCGAVRCAVKGSKWGGPSVYNTNDVLGL